MLARGEAYEQRDTGAQRSRGIQINAEAERQGAKMQSQKFRVGWDRREFKSVNYNYLNPL